MAISKRAKPRRVPTFIADRGDAAQRLDHAVGRHLGGSFGLSRSALQRLITTGRVLVNSVPTSRPAQRVLMGDVVQVDVQPPPARQAPVAEPLPLTIVYEDADLLVVVKPPGMVAHPSPKHRSGTLLNALLWHASHVRGEDWQPRLVQRLDRGTSGLVVVAKSAAVHTALQHDRDDLVKDYLAMVWGRPSPRRGAIDGPLGRDPLDRRRMMVLDTGAVSHTGYVVVAQSSGPSRGVSLVRLRLGTGRTHQIRVHLADRGWPIVGDPTYGDPPRQRLTSMALDRRARSFGRQALHAWRLRLRLPSSREVIVLEAPLPDDLAVLVAAAGLARGLAAHARRD